MLKHFKKLLVPKSPELSPAVLKLIDKAYCDGAAEQKRIDLAIIDKAIETCGAIRSWSEAARRARNDIANRGQA